MTPKERLKRLESYSVCDNYREKEKQHIDFQNHLNANAFKHKEMFYGHEYCYQYVKLYDYGKDWALTKKELEQ